MVKGITRQVIVVKSPDQKLFEQAIFLVRDDALTESGITEDALLQEARQVCKRARTRLPFLQKILWSVFGATVTGAVCAAVMLL